jgi:hypothetical protein
MAERDEEERQARLNETLKEKARREEKYLADFLHKVDDFNTE